MSKARDVMHIGATCIGENGTLSRAAEMMRDMHIGALPICGEDGRLQGIITDRDIVVRGIAEGYDPDVTTVLTTTDPGLIEYLGAPVMRLEHARLYHGAAVPDQRA